MKTRPTAHREVRLTEDLDGIHFSLPPSSTSPLVELLKHAPSIISNVVLIGSVVGGAGMAISIEAVLRGDDAETIRAARLHGMTTLR